MKQCENGHFYDELRFPVCPYCRKSPGVGSTVAVTPPQMEVGKTVAVDLSAVPGVVDENKTVGFISTDTGKTPPVGFVICISGPMKGSDFKILPGRNLIGRGDKVDIALKDDPAVSRDGHCVISYDHKHNSFIIAPGIGHGLTYLNDSPVETARGINSHDIIEIGNSRLIFLPLCDEHFKWEED